MIPTNSLSRSSTLRGSGNIAVLGIGGADRSMAPSLLIEFGSEALRNPRLSIFVARIASWARRSRAATGAGALALKGHVRMVFTDPAAILANEAFHGLASARRSPSFHSTSRITLRRLIRSSACTTSLLSSTASRRSTVRFESPRYPPRCAWRPQRRE
jgi:hypothetical protein